LSTSTIPRAITILAEALSRLHGPAVIRNESNGYHIYLPSPECLKTDGRKEIQSKHLTVNASRYKQTDDWVRKHGQSLDDLAKDYSAVCHKTDTKYKVSDLLNERKFPTLEKRGLPNISSKIIQAATQQMASLVDDGKGNMVPMDPGVVVPINSLPPFHPASVYLKDRGYDLDLLYKQFKCSFCTQENPRNDAKGIYYKSLPLDFKDTPQGRIVFYSFINGVQVGWQARIIERVEDNLKYYFHPYKNNWVAAEQKNTETGKWEPIPGIEIKLEGYTIEWKPSKYKTAFGMLRNETLMGLDAALDFNKKLGLKKPTVCIVEGPLDAGRIGPGAVALLGKYMSERHADLLVSKFKKLIVVADNDKAGREMADRIRHLMSDRRAEVVFVDIPDKYKDVGEMTYEAAVNLVFTHIN
jgi:5S rRNA maturation endonuclease (ribonuclease M5)